MTHRLFTTAKGERLTAEALKKSESGFREIPYKIGMDTLFRFEKGSEKIWA
jgi:hypothetical protein